MKFTLDNRFFFKFKDQKNKSLRLWKELGEGKHVAYLPSTVIAEFYSTVYLDMSLKQRLRVEEILKFSSVNGKEDVELSILINNAMPTLLFVGPCPSISKKAGELKRDYSLSLGDAYVAASHLKNTRSDFILSDDDDFNKIKNSVTTKSLDNLF